MSQQASKLIGKYEQLSGEFKPEIILGLLRERGQHVEADFIEGLSDQLQLAREEVSRLQRMNTRRMARKNRKKK